MTPQIGLVCFAIILVSWFGGVKYPKGIPAGLVAIAAGMLIAWGSNLFGLEPRRHRARQDVSAAFSNFGFSVPLPAFGHVFSGFEFLGIILVTAIPFGIYDLVEAMDNVESAEAAGDHYPTTRVLTADGVVSLIGCLMGNPFINAVYIGHPGWKAMGGRIGYSAATGLMVIVLSWFGIISLMLARDSGGRDLADPALHRHADRRAGRSDLAAHPCAGHRAVADAASALPGPTTLLDGALGAGRRHRPPPGLTRWRCTACCMHGLEVMGGGAILSGLVLGAIGVFIVEREFVKAAAFALAGAVLDLFSASCTAEAVGIRGDAWRGLRLCGCGGIPVALAKQDEKPRRRHPRRRQPSRPIQPQLAGAFYSFGRPWGLALRGGPFGPISVRRPFGQVESRWKWSRNRVE